MKNILLLALLTFIYTNPSHGLQISEARIDSVKVIVMINTAKWCPVCRANGQRIEDQVVSQFANNDSFNILLNDLSTNESKEASATKCKLLGISAIAEASNSSGVIYFIHAKTKEIISEISVTKSTEEVILAFNMALMKAKLSAN
ncbi:MAG: hypothetical protein KG003_00655 [Bacteroidetes bacterium]|nr:hypothetical protein [Bacteroidota bacterium]